MLNYDIKNIKKVLITSDEDEQTILVKDNSVQETIIIGGQVCNIDPDLAALFTMTIYNTITEDTVYLYKDIEIKPKDYLSITKRVLNQDQVLKAIITNVEGQSTDVTFHLTINYFDIVDYNYGFVRVSFLPALVYNQQPINPDLYNPFWRVVGTEIWYEGITSTTSSTSGSSGSGLQNYYIPLEKGDYSLEFSDIDGYVTPDNIDIEVEAMKLTEIETTYQIADSVVSFKILQIDGVNGFGWRLIDSDDYYEHNQYVVIEPGVQEIEFKEISSFVTPENQIYTFESQKVYSFNIEYERLKGYVTVNLDPPYLKLGKTHKYLNQFYILYPDGSSTKLYNSGERISLLTTTDSDIYAIVVPENQYFEAASNVTFSLEENDDLTYSITLETI